MIMSLQARKRFPYLENFAQDWPTKELAKSRLKNRRAYCKKQGYDTTDFSMAASSSSQAIDEDEMSALGEEGDQDEQDEGMEEGSGGEGDDNGDNEEDWFQWGDNRFVITLQGQIHITVVLAPQRFAWQEWILFNWFEQLQS